MPKVAPKGTEHQPSCAPPLPAAPVTHYAAPRPASAAAAPSAPLLVLMSSSFGLSAEHTCLKALVRSGGMLCCRNGPARLSCEPARYAR